MAGPGRVFTGNDDGGGLGGGCDCAGFRCHGLSLAVRMWLFGCGWFSVAEGVVYLKVSAGGFATTGERPVKPSRVSAMSRMRLRQAYQPKTIRMEAMAVTSMVRGESMKTMIRTPARKRMER